MRIDVWSDLVCPWCYIGKRRLEHALRTFEHRDDVHVVHRSFQLHPNLPGGTTLPRLDMLRAKYRLTTAQVEAMHERLERLAAEEGLAYDLSGGETGDTLDAHRLAHHARTTGQQNALIEQLFRAYFTEKRSLFTHESLSTLAAEAGLDAAGVAQVLGSDAYAEAVAADHREATDLGATGVPFFVLAGRHGVSGAQPVDVLAEAIRHAWATAPDHAQPASASSPAGQRP